MPTLSTVRSRSNSMYFLASADILHSDCFRRLAIFGTVLTIFQTELQVRNVFPPADLAFSTNVTSNPAFADAMLQFTAQDMATINLVMYEVRQNISATRNLPFPLGQLSQELGGVPETFLGSTMGCRTVNEARGKKSSNFLAVTPVD